MIFATFGRIYLIFVHYICTFECTMFVTTLPVEFIRGNAKVALREVKKTA